MRISIYLQDPLSPNDIEIYIDDRLIPTRFQDSRLFLDTPLTFGLHYLRIKSNTDQKISIKRVDIDGCDLRKLFYLHWLKDTQGRDIQPCSEMWEPGQTWNLPIGYPVSYWLNLVERKFANNVLGRDLSRDYWIWYPESLELGPHVPRIMRDFFEHNFDFTVIEKKDHDITAIPYIRYTKTIDQSLIDLSCEEIDLNRDLIIDHLSGDYGQKSLNIAEFGYKETDIWKMLYLHGPDQIESSRQRFPACWRLIDSLDLQYYKIFVGLLPPGAIIYPHTDDGNDNNPEFAPYQGCTHLYIPLRWPAGNYIKFASAGIPDVGSGAVIFNNAKFTHAVINDSDQWRYILGVRTTRKFVRSLPVVF